MARSPPVTYTAFERYLWYMSQNGVWGTELEWRAIQLMLGRPVGGVREDSNGLLLPARAHVGDLTAANAVVFKKCPFGHYQYYRTPQVSGCLATNNI